MIAPENFTVLADYVNQVSIAFQKIFEPSDPETLEPLPEASGYPENFPLQELVEFAVHSLFMDGLKFWAYSPSGMLHKVSEGVAEIIFCEDERGVRTRTTGESLLELKGITLALAA